MKNARRNETGIVREELLIVKIIVDSWLGTWLHRRNFKSEIILAL